jgi:putative ABC transport system substrate-binding protein
MMECLLLTQSGHRHPVQACYNSTIAQGVVLTGEHMRRREFITLLGGAAASPIFWSFAAWSIARAQTASSATRKIGVVTLGMPQSSPLVKAFITGLRELGYEPGKNIVLEFRSAEGRADRLSALVAEVMAQNVDIIVVESIAAAIAAKKASQTMPIVVAIASDPVGAGVFASLASPGGNATGLSLQSEEIISKRIQLIREVVPGTATIGILYNPNRPTVADNIKETESAARTFGIQLQLIPIETPDNLRMALEHVVSARPDAFMTLPDGMLLNLAKPIGEFSFERRLPGMFPERDFVESGGLMAYGPSLAVQFHRAAAYVDKILKGAKPADLPAEQPTRFELIVNLKSAKSLGLTLSPTIMSIADELIQ